MPNKNDTYILDFTGAVHNQHIESCADAVKINLPTSIFHKKTGFIMQRLSGNRVRVLIADTTTPYLIICSVEHILSI